MPDYLFASVIPSDIRPVRPTTGTGSPDGRISAPPGQLYTDQNGVIYFKDGRGPMTWVMAGTEVGKNPAVYVGNYFENDPNDLMSAPGPAVWYGYDKSVWVKTDSTDDAQNWVFLAFSQTVGGPNFYSSGGGELSQ